MYHLCYRYRSCFRETLPSLPLRGKVRGCYFPFTNGSFLSHSPITPLKEMCEEFDVLPRYERLVLVLKKVILLLEWKDTGPWNPLCFGSLWCMGRVLAETPHGIQKVGERVSGQQDCGHQHAMRWIEAVLFIVPLASVGFFLRLL